MRPSPSLIVQQRRRTVEECAGQVRAVDVAGQVPQAARQGLVSIILRGSGLAWNVTLEFCKVGRMPAAVPHLLCPMCGRRRYRLYVPEVGADLACRYCHSLTWQSRRDCDRALRGWSQAPVRVARRALQAKRPRRTPRIQLLVLGRIMRELSGTER